MVSVYLEKPANLAVDKVLVHPSHVCQIVESDQERFLLKYYGTLMLVKLSKPLKINH